jgi:NAD(P)-dependent dehydrogenase (short-subunit alcohol dehydrogenase family)
MALLLATVVPRCIVMGEKFRRWVITGANRGLGLEFARQLVDRGDFVVGACRRPDQAGELTSLFSPASGFVVALEVSSPESAAVIVSQRMSHVDVLINAAGTDDTAASGGPMGLLQGEALIDVYRTNSVGPALVTQAFTNLLMRSGRAIVVNLTSSRGSLNGHVAADGIGYAMSKAALNMLTRKMAIDLYHENIAVIAVSPGWVQTDMGGADAPITPEDSVKAMIAFADTTNLADTGSILAHSDLVIRSGAM